MKKLINDLKTQAKKCAITSNLRMEKLLTRAADAIEQLQPRWTPCSKELPEYDYDYYDKYGEDKPYIVMITGAVLPTKLYLAENGHWYDDNDYLYTVTAWQEMPEPFIEG